MAELLANWLNNEVELSQQVNDFEKDFSDSYLFGELLYKFNQQTDFKEFSKKDTVPTKIQNFQKLETTLRTLKIKFDSKMINGIMKGERGLALRLLYQLKMALEKVYPPTDIAVLRKTGKISDSQPAQKIAHSKEKYDQHAHVFFKNRLQELNKPQKQLNMENHLKKFSDEQKRQEKIQQKVLSEEREAKERIKDEIRKAQINKLQRNAGFMEEWLQKGVEDWQNNQSIKKDRERKQLEFEYKQAQKYNQITMSKINSANQEVHEGIEKFEHNLRTTYGIECKVQKEEAERAVSMSLSGTPMKKSILSQRQSQSMVGRGSTQLGQQMGKTTMKTNAMTLTSTGLKTKDKQSLNEQQRKERERRRRKMIVDQSKTHQDIQQNHRQQLIIDRLKKQSKQEQELSYEQWRTEQCKNVIIENRKLRDARYEKRRELDQQNENMREEEMLNQHKIQLQKDIEIYQERDTEMRISAKQAKRQENVELCQKMFDAIFDIANEAYLHQQQNDTQEIDQRNWKEWQQLFIEDMPIVKQIESEQIMKADEVLDDMELKDYLQNKGQWPLSLLKDNPVNIEEILTKQIDTGAPIAGKGGKGGAQNKAQTEQVQLNEDDKVMPEECPNNYHLGDAVEQIININNEARKENKKPKVPNFMSLKLCLVGYAFAGKKTQAKKLKEEFGLEVFYIDYLVKEALELYENNQDPIIEEANESHQLEQTSNCSEQSEKTNPQEDLRKCGQEIKSLILEGLEISDDLYVKLIISKLRMTFPYKSQDQIKEELREKIEKEDELIAKLEEIQSELDGQTVHPSKRKKKSVEQLKEEQDKIMQELQQVQQAEKQGWVLVDFPTNFAQAKLFEQALTGYIPKEECELIEREKLQQEAYLLVQPSPKESQPILLLNSGVDSVVWLEAEREETMRRALGRRYDQANDIIYHVQDQPPQTTSALVCERIVNVDQEDNCEGTLIDRWMAFDSNRKGLQNWLNQFGIESQKMSILRQINANQTQEEVFEQVKQIIDNIIQFKTQEENSLKQQIKDELRQQQEEEEMKLKEQQEEEQNQNQEDDQKDSFAQPQMTKPEGIDEKIPPKQPSIENLDNDFKPVLLQQWQQLSTNYKQQAMKVFRQFRVQRETITDYFSTLQKQFLNYLHRPDIKQQKLEIFIEEFNKFSDEFPDLREDDATKEELHQRVDILSDELCEITEERKQQEIEERKKIMESNYIENELATLVLGAQDLMQNEIDRFKQSIYLIQDYYHAFEDKLIPEAQQPYTISLVQEGEDLPPVEILPEGSDSQNKDSYLYPRLELLFQRALKNQVVQDVTQLQASGQDKKGAKGGKDQKKMQAQEEDKNQEESQYVKEMKQAIQTEKAILRFRLAQIRNWALIKLRQMREKSLQVYKKLDEWIYVATKAENEAVHEMCEIIKQAIESENKIQEELRIKFMDFCIDEKIMNFIIPPPEKLPQLEQVQSNRFTIQQLKSILNELQSISKQLNGQEQLPNNQVVDMLMRKLENYKHIGDENGLPQEWKDFTEVNFHALVRNLDRQNNGSVNWKVLATYLCLLNSPLPSKNDITLYKEALSEGNINKETFVNAKCWIDQYEFSQDREYSQTFPRVNLVKEIIFNINQDENEQVNVKGLLKMLKAKDFRMLRRGIKTYKDVLLQNIEK